MEDKQKEPYPYHVWLHEEQGIEVSNDQLDDWDCLIGDINHQLEKMYGCTIVYDLEEKTNKTIINGFAIFVAEEGERR